MRKRNREQDIVKQKEKEKEWEKENERGRRESRVFNFQAICPNAQRIDMFRRFVIGIVLNCD